jgi:3',5'-cyclic AMP phosphodiesterase CpdA
MRSLHTHLYYPAFGLLLFYAWFFWGGQTEKQSANKDMPSSTDCFICISDLHLDNSEVPSAEGCDTRLDLWNSFKHQLVNVIETQHPKFIVCTGDLPAHQTNLRCHQQEKATNLMKVLSDLDSIIYVYKLPFYYTPGNNDVVKGNYSSFTDEDGENIFTFYRKRTGRTFPVNETDHGYYSQNVNDQLEIISLNTIAFSPKYPKESKRKESELLWLDKQLAQLQGKKAYIIMHIPPGLDAYQNKGMWLKDSLDLFLDIISKHSSSIAGIFYGHTHNDELRRLYAPDNKAPMQIAISCPGISPDHTGVSQNNPGFKLMYYDPQTFKIRDFTTFYTHVPVKAQKWNSYSFHQIFGCDSLNALKYMPLDSVILKAHSIFWVDGVYHDNTFPDAAIEVKY